MYSVETLPSFPFHFLNPVPDFLAVHPCDQGKNGGCEQTCTKKGIDALCSCKKGFVLEEDGQSCEKGKLKRRMFMVCFTVYLLHLYMFHLNFYHQCIRVTRKIKVAVLTSVRSNGKVSFVNVNRVTY